MKHQKYFDKTFYSFFEQLLLELQSRGIDASQWPMDHVCYRCSDLAEYHRLCEDFSGTRLLSRAQINGREISIYKVPQPLVIRTFSVGCIEIPAPRADKTYSSGWEHCEFVIGDSFESFQTRHAQVPFEKSGLQKKINPDLGIKLPSGSVRFHHLPIESIVDIEIRRGLAVHNL